MGTSETTSISRSLKEPRMSTIDERKGDRTKENEPVRMKSQSEKIVKAKTHAQTQLNAPTGITGSVRRSLIGWFYPDVHDASENLGEGLEAHYDDKMKRWIFPGETPDQKDP